MFSRWTIFWFLFPSFLALLYPSLELNNVFLRYPDSQHDTGRRILLVTAHPDDESYFFAPTLLALLDHKRELRPTVYSLCLSIGDADGLGELRVGELNDSLDVLGVDTDKRRLISHPELQDNITVEWDPRIISNVVEHYARQDRIDTILTFDRNGVSGHPNHRSIPSGIIQLLSSNSTDLQPLPRLYTLVSVPLTVKFTGLLAAAYAKLKTSLLEVIGHPFAFLVLPSPHDKLIHRPVFISGVKEFLTTLSAIRQHKSQLVWFRLLYAAFSQYMWINQWEEVPL